MRKGQYLFKNDNAIIPYHFEPMTECLIPPIQEEFRDVTDAIVPGVLPYYMISNYGRLYHKYKNIFLNINIDSKGYPFKPLSTINGPKACRIHRLVLMTFNYFPGCENTLINHKDGNKANPGIWNLEWSNYSDNALEAIRMGYKKYTDKLPEQTVHDICKLLEKGNISIPDIAKMTGASYSIVAAIQGKRTHTDISDQYNIQPRKIVSNLSNEEVEKLCKFYQDNPKDNILDNYCYRALLSIGIPEENARSAKFLKTAKKIYHRETYRYISQYYNF